MDSPSSQHLAFDRPARYRIRVFGRLSEEWSDRMDGMTVERLALGETRYETRLSGDIPDQAALMGILNALYELHLLVLSVECLSCD
jgi:hypothetical protein